MLWIDFIYKGVLMIRFCSWNVEWMNSLFTTDESTGEVVFYPDDKVPYRGPKKATVLDRRNDLAGVIDELNLDPSCCN